jgi:hypothetical protein
MTASELKIACEQDKDNFELRYKLVERLASEQNYEEAL